MKKTIQTALIILLLFIFSIPAMATNGDNMIAIGPIARAMGGVGIAEPLDAISAVFSNPAAMCFAEYCPASEVNFAGTLFMPSIDTKIINSSGVIQADSDNKVYAIPAIGISVPMGKNFSKWRFGLAAYGVTGLGVDYRGTPVDNSTFYGGAPMISGEYTSLQIMKFAPSIAFQPYPNMSFGLALHIDYGTLDLRRGASIGYGFGIQPGMIYKISDDISLGLTYISAQKVDHERVNDFNQDGVLDDLELESPQQAGIGLSWNLRDVNAVVEADLKWINWADAEGYKEFDWNNQWVLGIGAQFKPTEKLVLRIGYNYGKNPVKEHNGFNGTFAPANVTNVQGKFINNYYYETFRIIGFPAVVEHHITLGVGYNVSPSFNVNLGYVHAFKETVRESGLDPTGAPVTLESTLKEDSLDFGLTWRF